jgi:hypothetical protein
MDSGLGHAMILSFDRIITRTYARIDLDHQAFTVEVDDYIEQYMLHLSASW